MVTHESKCIRIFVWRSDLCYGERRLNLDLNVGLCRTNSAWPSCRSSGYYLSAAICCYQLCQVQHCSSDIINTIVWRVRATANIGPSCSPLYTFCTPAMCCIAQHLGMPSNASMGIIKRRHLHGKAFRQIYLRSDLIRSPVKALVTFPCIDLFSTLLSCSLSVSDQNM